MKLVANCNYIEWLYFECVKNREKQNQTDESWRS